MLNMHTAGVKTVSCSAHEDVKVQPPKHREQILKGIGSGDPAGPRSAPRVTVCLVSPPLGILTPNGANDTGSLTFEAQTFF